MSNTRPDSSQVVFVPSGVGTVATTVQEKLRESVSVLDFGAVGDGVTDDRLKVIAAIAGTEDYGVLEIKRPYLISGAYGITIDRPMTLKFSGNGRFIFDNNNAEYLQTTSSDVILENPWIVGGTSVQWAGWIRTGFAAIRVKDNGSPVSGIEIIKPKIKYVCGAGILIGWSGEVTDVTVESPVVQFTKADGISVAYDVSDASITAPKCYDTGDDGISIVAYSSVANPTRNINITDALSVRSAARGITVIGGTDITVTGKSIDAALQGALILQDSGTYVTYAPERIHAELTVYRSGGNGIEIGRNAADITGHVSVVGAGSTGLSIGSAATINPIRINLSSVSVSGSGGNGINAPYVTDMSIGVINTSNNGGYGFVLSSSSNVSVGAINAYNNNTADNAGIDNIFYSNVTNFTIGSVVSTDDRGVALIERTFDLASCANGVIGAFNGIKGATINTVPNIQASCTNVRVSAEFVLKAGVPVAADIPARGFVLDTSSGTGRLYCLVGGTPRYTALT